MSDEIKSKELGPLAPLSGIWEGDKGIDVALSDSRGSNDCDRRARVLFDRQWMEIVGGAESQFRISDSYTNALLTQ